MRLRHLTPGLLAAGALLAGTASAQTPLIQNGDVVGLVGTVTAVWRVEVDSSAQWAARVDTDADSASDECVVWNGTLFHQEGTDLNLSAPALATYAYLDSLELDDNGNLVTLVQLDLNGGGSGRGLYRNGQLLLEQDVSPCNAVGVPANSVYSSLAEVWVNNSNQILVGGRVDDGNGDLDCMIRLTLDAGGAIVTEELLMIDGQQPAGHNAPITGFYQSDKYNAMNDLGQCLFPVDDDNTDGSGASNTCCDSHLYLDGARLIDEGTGCNAVPGRLYGHISTFEVDLNNSGDWVMNVNLDSSDNSNNSVLIKNDSTIVSREGDLLANVGAGTFALTSYGGAPVRITPEGDVVWYGDWDDADTDVDTGLFRNDELLVQEGMPLAGDTLDTFDSGADSFDLSENGRYLVFIATLTNGTEAAWLLELLDEVGTNYCSPAQNNSTGGPASIVALGSDVAADNSLVLSAEGLPQNQFGYFLNSTAQGFTPFPGGSQGHLCLIGGIGRYVDDIFNSGASGTGQLALDLTDTPTPSGSAAIVAGQTWYFQCWYRDLNPTATSNFTDATAVTFN